MLNEKDKKDLEKSILKPYLIHVEFELINILDYFKKDGIIRSEYANKGFNIRLFESTLDDCIQKLGFLHSIFNYSIN